MPNLLRIAMKMIPTPNLVGGMIACLLVFVEGRAAYQYLAIQFHQNLLADALCSAASTDDVKRVRALLAEGADPLRPNTMDETTTPLDTARQGQRGEVLKLFEAHFAKSGRRVP